MSYILEALKKSQAERQLGSAPTIHAMPIDAVATAQASPRGNVLWMAIAGVAVTGAAAFVLFNRPQPAPAQVPAPVPAPAPVAAVVPVPVPVAPAPLAAAPKAPVPKPVAQPKPLPVAAPPADEEQLRALHQLPEALQREIPQVVFGGYMYSNNPADRLLLVDKVLRHEGEQVAPGLVLEKLEPKAAVMNYKGNRYRVPY